MPWRNGGGITHEVASERGRDDALIWRISTARVEADGPYSLFPGLTRLSAVVEGDGVRLRDMDDNSERYCKPGDVVRLSGDRLYQGELLDGGIRHLNTIFDEGLVTARVSHVANESLDLPKSALHFLYCIRGQIQSCDVVAPPGAVLHADPGTIAIDALTSAVWIELRRVSTEIGAP